MEGQTEAEGVQEQDAETYLGQRRRRSLGSGGNCTVRSFMTHTAHQIEFRSSY